MINIQVSDNFNHFINFNLVNGLKGKKVLKVVKFFNIHRDNNLLEKISLNNKRELNTEIPASQIGILKQYTNILYLMMKNYIP